MFLLVFQLLLLSLLRELILACPVHVGPIQDVKCEEILLPAHVLLATLVLHQTADLSVSSTLIALQTRPASTTSAEILALALAVTIPCAKS